MRDIQVYLFVDYDAQPPVFRLTPRDSTVPAVVAVSSASCPGGLTPEKKGLISLGAVLGALVIGLLVYALYRRHKKKTGDSKVTITLQGPLPPRPAPSTLAPPGDNPNGPSVTGGNATISPAPPDQPSSAQAAPGTQ